MTEENVAIRFDSAGLESAFNRDYLVGLSVAFPEAPLNAFAAKLARQIWEDRARAEYIGVFTMHRFWALCADIGAPVDVQELALRMTLDEQRHTSICISAVLSFGGNGVIAFKVDELQQPRTEAPLEFQFVEMVVSTLLVGETIARELLSATVRALPPSLYRDALREILRDEVQHASAGAAILRSLRAPGAFLPWPGDSNVEAMFERAISVMRLRDVVRPTDQAAFDAAEPTDIARTGVVSPSFFRDTYFDALDRLEASALRSLM